MKTLWRVSDDDYLPDAASFASDREDAEAYLDNPGYGGRKLFRARVEVDRERVLSLFYEDDPIRILSKRFHQPHPGAIGPEEWIPMRPDLQAAIHDAGFDWVIVKDSFPEGAETWIWLGEFNDEPELIEVKP